jgi:hypothetical protein
MKQEHFLTTHGNTIINQNGDVINLHGFGLGGWMNLENFILIGETI